MNITVVNRGEYKGTYVNGQKCYIIKDGIDVDHDEHLVTVTFIDADVHFVNDPQVTYHFTEVLHFE